LVSALSRLSEIAVECGENPEKFKILVEHEQPLYSDKVLAQLGPSAFDFLKRIDILNLPREFLKHLIQTTSRQLAGAKSQQLVDFLFRKLVVSAPARLRLDLNDIITEARQLGIEFFVSPTATVAGVDKETLAILFCLQSCRFGVPKEIIATVFGGPESKLDMLIASAAGSGLVTDNGGLVTIARLPNSIVIENGMHVRRSLLRSLLSYIKRNKNSTEARRQVFNAIAVSKTCLPGGAEDVACLFDAVEKPLKRVGNKHLLFEAAELTINAAKSAHPGSLELRQAEAKALICGRSWFYQRVDELVKARVAADESLQLGEDIGYERNSAYCKKCIGRLCRIAAEQANESSLQRALLQESRLFLMEAIDRFSKHPDFGPGSVEVGDCYSLLGRTYLEIGDLRQAENAVRRAHELLDRERESKDYIDLLILEGDLLARKELFENAISAYDTALMLTESDDAEKNEMTARAYFRRGLAQLRMKRLDSAKRSIDTARDIWEQLNELEPAARAQWVLLDTDSPLPGSAHGVLSKEKFLVRVEVFKTYQSLLSGVGTAHHARREDPGASYWRKLVIEARKKIALEVPHL
jgi:tetratricopeptide (TPR) repeat protein